MEEDFFDPDYLLPYIRPDRLSPDAFQRISELSKLKIPRHFLKKYVKTHFRATITKAQLRNFKDGLYKIPTSPPEKSPSANDLEDFVAVEEWPSARIPDEEIPSKFMEASHYTGQDMVRTSNDANHTNDITDEALADALDRANREQMIRLAVPRLGSRLSLWQLLILHCKVGETPEAIITLLLEEFLNFVKHVQDFLRRQLDRVATEFSPDSAHDGLWRKQQASPLNADVANSLHSSQLQKSPWQPRWIHKAVQNEEGVKSTSQKNPLITVTGGLVQIETAEQAAILGLPHGGYRMRLPPDFVRPPPPPPKCSRADFSTSQQLASSLSSDIAGTAGSFASPSPGEGMSRSITPTTTSVPLSPTPSTQSTAVKTQASSSRSFTGNSNAPTKDPVADQSLPLAQPTPQTDTASQVAARTSTVLKHRFCLLPGLKKPLELPLPETGSSIPTDSQSIHVAPPDASSPPGPEFEKSPLKSVVASTPITPPISSSQSTSEQYPPVSEPPAEDPPISEPLSHSTSQTRLLTRDLGGPIPDEWISSGRFQPLVLDSGSPSPLVLEPASGGIFHRNTGCLVFRAPPGSSPLLLPPPLSNSTSKTPSSTVNFSSTDATTTVAISSSVSTPITPSPVGDSPLVPATNGSVTVPPKSPPEPPQKRQCTRDSPASSSSPPPPSNSLPQPSAALDQPLLKIERISASRVVVTRVDGARFMVDDGGNGLTQTTIETILQLGR
uniref:Uncharacterized protein n=3 Tax=Schistocephalus solidus TaxID=70667 RepID=A0A0X3PKX9_SCHSO